MPLRGKLLCRGRHTTQQMLPYIKGCCSMDVNGSKGQPLWVAWQGQCTAQARALCRLSLLCGMAQASTPRTAQANALWRCSDVRPQV